MPMKLNKTDMRKAYSRLEALKTRTKKLKQQGEKVTENVISMTETGAGAFAMGFTQGRYGGIEIVGIPLELGLGVTLNLAGWLGFAGKHSSHLHAFGNGCLSAYMTQLGRGVGAAGSAGGVFDRPREIEGDTTVQGLPSGYISDDELSALVYAQNAA